MVRPIQSPSKLSKAVLVRGLRTPFLKQGTDYKRLSALELGTMVVRELIERTELDPAEIDAVVFGQVVPNLAGPNIAREIVLAANLVPSIDAYSVNRACATSTQAIADAAMLIQTGHAKVVIAGGADSASDVPITVSKPLSEALLAAFNAKRPLDKLRAFSALSAKDLLPVPPALRELSTQLTMGQSAEKMAKANGISREAQDAFAHRSHVRASKAIEDGLFVDEVMTARVPPTYAPVSHDNIVRKKSDLASYAKLAPAFDKKHGTITAANSSPLTDGAAAVVLMRYDVARALGYKPLATIRASAFAALDPFDQLLMGPAYAIPRLLDSIGLDVGDIDLVDLHEAFAAQVLSNLQAFGSKAFAKDKLNREAPIGEIDDARLNVHGGSIALGHPFAATGARQLTTVANELHRRGGGWGLIAQCAAGGLGAALAVEA